MLFMVLVVVLVTMLAMVLVPVMVSMVVAVVGNGSRYIDVTSYGSVSFVSATAAC